MISPYSIASKFIGRKEITGLIDDPMIMEWLTLDKKWPAHDEVPWCAAFVNWVCWLSDVPRSKSLLARSWLDIGQDIPLKTASQGFDVVILKRGIGIQPGPENRTASGHVGFYSYYYEGSDTVFLLGGNQGNQVSVKPYPASKVIGVRRLSG